MRLPAVLAALLLILSAPAHAVDLAAHHAVYSLSLDPGHRGDMVAASGTMGYEVTDACDGWVVRQRLRMTITDSDGHDSEMVSDYATWEAKDGLSFNFHVKQSTDGSVSSQTDGKAVLARRGGPGEARYSGSGEDVKHLPAGTVFPMAHTHALIVAAREGKRFFIAPLFDGTVEDGAQDSSAAILDWQKPHQTKYADLSALYSTRVRLAFFDRAPGTQTPDYQVGMRYWENGVADEMQMDFGDFSVNAKLTEYSPQPHRC